MKNVSCTYFSFWSPKLVIRVGFLFVLLVVSGRAWAQGSQPSSLTVGASSATVCSGTSATLTASGCPVTGTVRWSTSQTGAVIRANPTQTTSYTATCDVVVSTTATSSSTASGTALTSTSATGTVQVYTPISASLTSQSALCNGSSDGRIAVTATGGVGKYTYQLGSQVFQTGNSFSGLKAGGYNITVKDSVGCTNQFPISITQPTALSANVLPIAPKCVGSSDGRLMVTGSGGNGDYRYALNGGTPQTSGTFTGLSSTTYTITISDKNSCTTSLTATVGVPSVASVRVTPQATRCVGSADGSLSVSVTSGSGAVQYQLNTGDFQTGSQFTGLAAGTYTITAMDENGCKTAQTATVSQPNAIQLTLTSRTATCAGPNTGAVLVAASGGTGTLSYQLSGRSGSQTATTFGSVPAGEYTVVATDANGCSNLASISVGQVTPLRVQALVTSASCCTCPTGAIQLSTTGGSGSGAQYQLVGQANQTGSQFTRLVANTYQVRVTDDGGCRDSASVVVPNATAISLSLGSVKNVSCSGLSDGTATVLTSGGVRPFRYFWITSGRDTLANRTATQTALSAGSYTISVRDSNNCTATTLFVSLSATAQAPAKPVVSQVATSTLVVNQTAGVQWYLRSGGSTGQAVSGATSATLVPYASGQYYVITTLNGCASPASDAVNFVLTAAEKLLELAVRVYPNPVVDRLCLEIEQPERAAVQLQLLDASGRTVKQYQLPAFVGRQQADWPVTDLPLGIYFLNVKTDKRQAVLRVLMK